MIPNLDGFTRIGTVRCPIEDISQFKEGSLRSKVKTINNPKFLRGDRHPSSCELWRKKEVVGEKVTIGNKKN